MSGIVVYSSKTGFTKQYAQWIAEALDIDAIALDDYLGSRMSYDYVIYGGWLKASNIVGFNKVKEKVKDTKLIVFTTGAVSEEYTDIVENMRNQNFSSEEQEQIAFFYYAAGVDYGKLSFLNRKLLQMMRDSLKKKTERTREETAMFEALTSEADASNQTKIIELVDLVKKEI